MSHRSRACNDTSATIDPNRFSGHEDGVYAIRMIFANASSTSCSLALTNSNLIGTGTRPLSLEELSFTVSKGTTMAASGIRPLSLLRGTS